MSAFPKPRQIDYLEALKDMNMEEDIFLTLLTKVIGESKYVQNNPRGGLIPEEGKVAKHIFKELEPFTTENGGPLEVTKLEYVPNRPNIKIKLPGLTNSTIGIIGSHMDVVPANPETWQRDPFKLIKEGDKLYGRGTTDCLGHVCLLTRLMCDLAKRNVKLNKTVVVIFICGEEGGEHGVGVDQVVARGDMEELKNGPCFWVDSADSQPCVGTAGALQWHLKTTGRLFHSGLPHKGINSLELGMEALAEIQKRFYADFPPHPDEKKYNFATPSTMKPTQMECAKGALNQLPPWTTISGDVRLTPFYDAMEVVKKVNEYVEDLNKNIQYLPTRGPCSKYTLEGEDVDVKRGVLEFKWSGEMSEIRSMEGIACNLNSPGLQAIIDATAKVKGSAEPYAITGSLPLVKEMQTAGFDIQITGYGLSKTYHADNEYALLSEMMDAYQILLLIISSMDSESSGTNSNSGL